METLLPLLKWLEYAILLLLVGLSIWSVSIIIDRRRNFRKAQTSLGTTTAQQLIRTQDWTGLKKWSDEQSGMTARLLQSLFQMTAAENVSQEKAARSLLIEERQKLEKGLNILATLGSNAPFIGLFGTVLGIIQAFSALSVQETGSTTVMASIANALVATAAGLFVAIPAVIAFNIFTGKLRDLLSDAEAVKELYLAYRIKKETKDGK